jgi:putative ABC transport system permease protein
MRNRLSWYQLISEKRKLLAALAGVTFAVLLQMMQFGFRDALFESSTTIHSQLRADLLLISPQFEYILSTGIIPRRRLYQALGLPQVESVAPVYFAIGPLKNPETGAERVISILAFDPNEVVLEIPSVIQNAAHLKVPDVAIFDELSLPNNFGPVVENVRERGSVMTEVNGRRMKVAGLFQLGASFSATGYLIVSDTTFRRLFARPEGVFEFGLVRLKPGSDVLAAQAALTRLLPPDVKVVTRQEFVDLEHQFWSQNSPIGFIFLAGSLIGLLVGAVIIYQILYTDITDHMSQYATLKAMGYRDRYLYSVVFGEAVILSILGFPIGVLLSQVLYSVARDATRLPIEMNAQRAVIVLALTVGMAAFSCIVAMRKLRKADPAECF